MVGPYPRRLSHTQQALEKTLRPSQLLHLCGVYQCQQLPKQENVPDWDSNLLLAAAHNGSSVLLLVYDMGIFWLYKVSATGTSLCRTKLATQTEKIMFPNNGSGVAQANHKILIDSSGILVAVGVAGTETLVGGITANAGVAYMLVK